MSLFGRELARGLKPTLRRQTCPKSKMPHEIRKRILRPTTPEEAARHKLIREQIEQELPELAQWARAAIARHPERVAVAKKSAGGATGDVP